MQDMLRSIIKEQLKWDFADVTVQSQEDGLTNWNYTILKDNTKYAVRISGNTTGDLGINRAAELAAMKMVASTGIGAEVMYFSVDTGNMITRFIDGKKWTNEDAAIPENMIRIAGAMRKIHTLPPIPYHFSPYKDIEDRIRYANQNGLELPGCLDKLLDKLDTIKYRRELEAGKYLGLCHNDPFPNNFIDDGNVRLLDWEYAGMGDIFFDLACICTCYPEAGKVQFLEYYFGYCDDDKRKSLEEMNYVVAFWNAMWAVVQTKLNSSQHDYKAFANHMFTYMENDLLV